MYAEKIKAAMSSAQRNVDQGETMEALLALEPMRPYMQANSKLGSAALFELARVYEYAKREDDARRIYEDLSGNPQSHVRRQAKTLLSTVRSRIERLSRPVGWWRRWSTWEKR
eukprot:gnl/TRDRNA2_/TRDRNA2_120563_c1_seq1.p1 gnl/TRDRNA2_/TRDRNA2_120563_c1~~gnl/TRDRNA2_/TRDRNA2_120563_c1_seq1.p1  ORF type:complete len:123 (-),score=20.95 gnl/TRDRNA2_/TRDRNA2_120563_c1_seq1:379-717(-)